MLLFWKGVCAGYFSSDRSSQHGGRPVQSVQPGPSPSVWAVTPVHVKVRRAETLCAEQFSFYLRIIDVVESSAAVQQRRRLVPGRIVVRNSRLVSVARTHWVDTGRLPALKLCVWLKTNTAMYWSIVLQWKIGAVAVDNYTCPNNL